LRNTGTNVATVPNLILAGGAVYAGTLNNVTSILDGHITVTTNSALTGYWNATGPRHLRILSLIRGAGVLTSSASDPASTHELQIVNSSNTFAGTWVSSVGTIRFAHAGAVGTASIVVQENGKLVLPGDWNQAAHGATLTVADAATALVELGSHQWTLAGLIVGNSNLVDGTYTAAQLSAMGGAVFSGTGAITVIAPVIEPPTLKVMPSGNTLVFSWTDNDFKLQVQTNSLLGPWFDYPDGDRSPVPIPMDRANPSVFYRLLYGP
jgi:hypothetical protein